MFWKKKKKEAPQDRIILGMVLLRDTQPLDFETLFQDVRLAEEFDRLYARSRLLF